MLLWCIFGKPVCCSCFPRVPTRTQSQQAPQEEVVDRAQPSCSPCAADPEPPPPPSNSFQLEAQLHKIGNQPEVVYRYLRVSKRRCNLCFRTAGLHSVGGKCIWIFISTFSDDFILWYNHNPLKCEPAKAATSTFLMENCRMLYWFDHLVLRLCPVANQAWRVWRHSPQLAGTRRAPEDPEDSARFLPEVSF